MFGKIQYTLLYLPVPLQKPQVNLQVFFIQYCQELLVQRPSAFPSAQVCMSWQATQQQRKYWILSETVMNIRWSSHCVTVLESLFNKVAGAQILSREIAKSLKILKNICKWVSLFWFSLFNRNSRLLKVVRLDMNISIIHYPKTPKVSPPVYKPSPDKPMHFLFYFYPE